MSKRIYPDWREDDEPTEYTYLGEIEWSYQSWEFDITGVFRKDSTGELFYATDSGCSCPSPWDRTTEDDLTLITRPQDFIEHTNGQLGYSSNEAATVDDVRKLTLVVFDHFEKQRKAA